MISYSFDSSCGYPTKLTSLSLPSCHQRTLSDSRVMIGPTAGCHNSGSANTLATGATLVALILVFGPISGAHLNPAVTLAQAWQRGMSIVVRTSGDADAAAPAIRRALKSVDPALAIKDVQTLNAVVGSSLA